MPQPIAYTQEGQPIADDQLASAVASKQARFPKGIPVSMLNGAGEVIQVPSEHAWTMIQQGAQPLTSAELAQRAEQKASEESYGQSGLALAHGAANTLGMGIPDVVGTATIPGYKEGVQKLEKYHPFEEGVGTVGALAIPIAGELGLGGRAVRALGAPLNTISTIARGAGEGLAAAVPEGMARGLVRGATTGAVEGAAWGAGQTAQAHAIYDEPITADRVIFNGALGGGLGGILGLASEGISKLSTTRPRLGVRPEEVAAQAAPEGMERTAIGAPTATLGQRFRSTMDEISVAQTIKGATGATGSDVARLTRLGGKETLSRLAGRIDNELSLRPGASLGEAVDQIESMRRVTGTHLDEIIRDLDTRGARIDSEELLTAARTRVLDPLRASGVPELRALANRVDEGFLGDLATNVEQAGERFQKAERLAMVNETREAANSLYREIRALGTPASEAWSQVKQELNGMLPQLQGRARSIAEEEVGQRHTMSVGEATKLRRDIDRFLEGKRDLGKSQLSKKEQLVLGLRNEMQKNINEQVARVDAPLARTYGDVSAAHRDWSLLAPIAKKRFGARAGNRFISLTDNLHATGAAAVGAAMAGPTGLLAAVPAVALNHFGRSVQGSRMAGKLARKLAGKSSTIPKLDLATEAANNAGRIAEDVRSKVTEKAFSIEPKPRQLAYKLTVGVGRGTASVANIISRLQETPNLVEHAGMLAEGIDHPELRRHLAAVQTAGREIAFEEIPKCQQPMNPALGKHQPPPSEALMHEYAEIISIVNKPAVAIEMFKQGKLTKKHVEILGRLVPNALNEVQKHALMEFSKQTMLGKTPPYQSRLQLGTLLGGPIDSTHTPGYIETVQNFYQSTTSHVAPRSGGRSRSESSRTDMADRRMTPSERVDRI